MEKKEIKTFTEQDMIEFGQWLNQNASRNDAGTWVYFHNTFYTKTTKELFDLWEKKRVPAIKSTSELGCMLDTERPWMELPREINTPNDTRDVEVRLKDGIITFGWFGGCWWVDDKRGYKSSCHFPEENPNNPVVAWRELVTDNTEK